jgi:hypothetical protein
MSNQVELHDCSAACPLAHATLDRAVSTWAKWARVRSREEDRGDRSVHPLLLPRPVPTMTVPSPLPNA